MSTASAGRAGPPTVPEQDPLLPGLAGPNQPRRREPSAWWVGCAITFIVAGLSWLFFGELPLDRADVRVSLIWGHEVAQGGLPDYQALAVTPHPLHIAVGAFASLLGTDGATDFMRAIALLSVGAVAAMVFLLGRACFSTAVGALAAFAFVVTPEFVGTPLTGTVDGPFIALVTLAATLEARRPRRGTAVLVVLGAAGLLRPEAWVLAGAYWLYLAAGLDWPARLRLAALVATAPLLWALSDLVITGNPVYSLTATRDILTTGALGQRTVGIQHVPSAITTGLRDVLLPPVLVGGAVGFFLAIRQRRGRALLPPAVTVLIGLWFLVLGAAGLPLNRRYLLLPALMLTILFGFAALAWRDRIGTRERRLLSAVGLATVVVFAAYLPSQIGGLRDLRSQFRYEAGVHRDLRALIREPGTHRLLSGCPKVYAASAVMAPLLAYESGLDPGKVHDAFTDRPVAGLVVVPATAKAGGPFMPSQRRAQLAKEVSGRFNPVASNRSFTIYARGIGRACGGAATRR